MLLEHFTDKTFGSIFLHMKFAFFAAKMWNFPTKMNKLCICFLKSLHACEKYKVFILYTLMTRIDIVGLFWRSCYQFRTTLYSLLRGRELLVSRTTVTSLKDLAASATWYTTWIIMRMARITNCTFWTNFARKVEICPLIRPNLLGKFFAFLHHVLSVLKVVIF